MSTIKINTSGITSNVIPPLKTANSKLSTASTTISSISIPSDFSYKSTLRGMTSTISSIKTSVTSISTWANNAVTKFNNAETKSKNVVNSMLAKKISTSAKKTSTKVTSTKKITTTIKNAVSSTKYKITSIFKTGAKIATKVTSIVANKIKSSLSATKAKIATAYNTVISAVKSVVSSVIRNMSSLAERISTGINSIGTVVATAVSTNQSVLEGTLMTDTKLYTDVPIFLNSESGIIGLCNYISHKSEYDEVVSELEELNIIVSADCIKSVTDNSNYKVIELYNGIMIYLWKNNNTATIYYTDGNSVNINSNGKKLISYNDGTAQSSSRYFQVVNNEDGSKTIYYSDGTVAYVDTEGNARAFDSDGNAIEVFCELNREIGQYGGSQMAFNWSNERLLQDEKIRAIIKQYWPDATDENMELLMYKLCNVGCGYTALINTIFIEYEGKEDEFEEKFGFPMYTIDESTGKIDYNYEYLILEFFCYTWQDYDIEELYGNIDESATDGSLSEGSSEGVAKGTSWENTIGFKEFLSMYGIDCITSSGGNINDETGEITQVDVNSISSNYDEWVYNTFSDWISFFEYALRYRLDGGHLGSELGSVYS